MLTYSLCINGLVKNKNQGILRCVIFVRQGYVKGSYDFIMYDKTPSGISDIDFS